MLQTNNLKHIPFPVEICPAALNKKNSIQRARLSSVMLLETHKHLQYRLFLVHVDWTFQ